MFCVAFRTTAFGNCKIFRWILLRFVYPARRFLVGPKRQNTTSKAGWRRNRTGLELETGTVAAVFQEPKSGPEPSEPFPVLAFLDFLFCQGKENPPINQGFFSPAEPTKNLEKNHKKDVWDFLVLSAGTPMPIKLRVVYLFSWARGLF